jgi:hypothetical protein
VAFFFIARKAYHVTASATLHSDSCNKAEMMTKTLLLFYKRREFLVSVKHLSQVRRREDNLQYEHDLQNIHNR